MGITDFSQFEGKIVVLYVADAPRPIQDGVVLEFPQLQQHGERFFIHGRIPELGGADWVTRLQAGVAWDSVVSYLIFNSRDEYLAKMNKSRPSMLGNLLSRLQR